MEIRRAAATIIVTNSGRQMFVMWPTDIAVALQSEQGLDSSWHLTRFGHYLVDQLSERYGSAAADWPSSAMHRELWVSVPAPNEGSGDGFSEELFQFLGECTARYKHELAMGIRAA